MNNTDEIKESAEEQEEGVEPEEQQEEQPEESQGESEDTVETEEQPDTQPDEEESFKQKYLSLKGKYDSEVPRLNQELKEFKQQVFDRLGDQQRSVPQEPQPETKEPELPEKVKNFLEEYGDEYADGLEAYLNHLLESKLPQTMQPVQERLQEFEGTQVKVAQENFAAYLDENVNGDWRALWEGKDAGFVDFLQQPDPSGLYTYGDLVRMYNDNWDADRLAGVLNMYVGEREKQQEAPKPPIKEQRIAPNRRSTEVPKPQEKARVWTRDMIAEFQAKDRRGEYDAEESQALWNDLLAAPNENRVRD